MRLLRHPSAFVGTLLFVVFLILAAIGPLIAPYGFKEQNIEDRLKPPSADHLFGTDQYGRDVLSRILVGPRGVFLLGGTGTILAALVGISIGLFSGYYGGLWDEIVMRVLEIFLSFPSLLLALVLLSTIAA